MKRHRTRALIGLAVTLTCFAISAAVSNGKAEAQEKPEQPERIRALQEKRLSLWVQGDAKIEKAFADKYANWSLVFRYPLAVRIKVKSMILGAQLDLCRSKDERVKVYENMIKGVEKVEQDFQKFRADYEGQLRGGSEKGWLYVREFDDIILVQDFLLQLSIALEKERGD